MPGIARVRVLRTTELGEMQVAEGPQPVVDGDDDHVAAPGEGGAVVHRPRPRTGGEGAAVNPEHDRAQRLWFQAAGPHVEHQAVLAHRRFVAGESVYEAHERGARAGVAGLRPGLGRHGHLGRGWAVGGGVTDTGPRNRRGRRLESVAPTRVGAIGDAPEVEDPIGAQATDLPGSSLDDRFAHGPSHSLGIGDVLETPADGPP